MPSSSSSSRHLSSPNSINRTTQSSVMRSQPDPSKSRKEAKASIAAVRYTECRKNHAASIGGYAVDGCREFMASGEEGTAAALRCAACNCHRSFHKREVDGGETPHICDCSSNSTSTSTSSSSSSSRR